MLESYHKLQQMLKTVPEFTNALQLIWFELLEKAIDNAVKNHRKQLQWWTFWTFNMMIHLTDTNCYIWLNIIWCDLFLRKNSWIS